MKEDGKATKRNSHVWLSRTLLNLDEAFGFSCQHFETAKDDFLDIIHRFKVGKDVADDELPQVMWCDNAQDDRKKRLPHLFKAGGFFMATQEAKDVLTGFDLGASRFVPVQLFHRDRKTPWPGTHYFLYMPDRIPAFSPEHSRRYKPKRFEDQSHTGTIPFDVADGDISVSADALTGQDMWQDTSLLWSLFFTDQVLAAIREAGLMGDMQIARCPVVR